MLFSRSCLFKIGKCGHFLSFEALTHNWDRKLRKIEKTGKFMSKLNTPSFENESLKVISHADKAGAAKYAYCISAEA